MQVLFLCGREPEYVRNQIILKALRQQAAVVEVTDSSKGYIIRHLRLACKLLTRLRQHDVVFVGFYGFLLVYLVRLFSRRPLIFDAYLSTYNTLCLDRRHFAPNSPIGRLVFWMDKLACQLSDVVLLDTRAHRDYFVQLYNLPPEKFVVLYLGYDEDLFYPRRAPSTPPFRVFYYGSFLPVQGIDHIVHAAKLLLNEPDITFQIAGHGSGYAEIRALAERLGCTNIAFTGWVPYEQLPEAIAQASVCLGGHFSGNSKAQNVIATKTYQFLAMARPTIVGDNLANREIFTHGEHVYMCRVADAAALAAAILALRDNAALREHIAWGGYARLTEHYSITRISQVLQEIIEQVYAPVPR
jgi:glycosyltransferase involved in cell wall biosynthesis